MPKHDKKPHTADTNRQNRQNLPKHDPKLFSQSVTVNVTVNDKDDGLEEAAKGCFKCCLGIGKAATKP